MVKICEGWNSLSRNTRLFRERGGIQNYKEDVGKFLDLSEVGIQVIGKMVGNVALRQLQDV